jgi:hypothetical protein
LLGGVFGNAALLVLMVLAAVWHPISVTAFVVLYMLGGVMGGVVLTAAYWLDSRA